MSTELMSIRRCRARLRFPSLGLNDEFPDSRWRLPSNAMAAACVCDAAGDNVPSLQHRTSESLHVDVRLEGPLSSAKVSNIFLLIN